MKLSIQLHTCIIKSGWSIVYIEGVQVTISKKNITFVSLKINFVLANSADPDEIPHGPESGSTLFAKVPV